MSKKTNVNEDPINTNSHPKIAEQRPKELIRTRRHRVKAIFDCGRFARAGWRSMHCFETRHAPLSRFSKVAYAGKATAMENCL